MNSDMSREEMTVSVISSSPNLQGAAFKKLDVQQSPKHKGATRYSVASSQLMVPLSGGTLRGRPTLETSLPCFQA